VRLIHYNGWLSFSSNNTALTFEGGKGKLNSTQVRRPSHTSSLNRIDLSGKRVLLEYGKKRNFFYFFGAFWPLQGFWQRQCKIVLDEVCFGATQNSCILQGHKSEGLSMILSAKKGGASLTVIYYGIIFQYLFLSENGLRNGILLRLS